MTKRFGFTLAEVLITLGIIGVVAAMTIPTLIANTNGAKFRSQFKKTISTLNQAGLMAQAQYDFDYAGTSAVCTSEKEASDHPESVMTFCAILNGTLTGQTFLGTSSNVTRNNNGTAEAYTWKNTAPIGMPALEKYYIYSLADGSLVGFDKTAQGCELPIGTQMTSTVLSSGGKLASCLGFIDVNGPTLPNKFVSCSDTSSSTSGGSESKGTMLTPPAYAADAAATAGSSLTPETPCVVKKRCKSHDRCIPDCVPRCNSRTCIRCC